MKIINAGQVVQIAADKLELHPSNPRQGNLSAIRESIQANGFYGALVAQKSTGYILAGNHRFQVGRDLGMEEFPVIYVDCDDAEALRILLVDNRSNDLAGWDREGLLNLLESLDSLDGTGYSAEDLSQLSGALKPPDLDDGLPEFTDPNVNAKIGDYQFTIPREDYLEWIEDIRQEAGFDEDSVCEEILCRLNLSPSGD